MRLFTRLAVFAAMALACVCPPQTARAQANSVEPVAHYRYIDWNSMRVIATGMGARPANAETMGQWRAMAARASVLDARRNLLEVILGVHIDSRTVVRNFVTESDTVVSTVSGVLTGSVIEETTQLEDGSFRSVVSMPLTGDLARELMPYADPLAPPPGLPENAAPVGGEQESPVLATPDDPLPAPDDPVVVLGDPVPEPDTTAAPLVVPLDADTTEAEPAGETTGLVIDARDLEFQPSMRPELHGPDGLLYPGPNVDEDTALNRGYVRYYQDLSQAQSSDMAGGSPLTVTAASLAEGDQGALMLDPEDAARLDQALAEPGNYLDSCNVVIVF